MVISQATAKLTIVNKSERAELSKWEMTENLGSSEDATVCRGVPKIKEELLVIYEVV
jgi:Trp operon repressor